MISKDLATLKINKLTKAQYEAAKTAGTLSEEELYMTPSEEATVDLSNIPTPTIDTAAANKKYVDDNIATLRNTVNNKAPLASPIFTGTPKTSSNTNYTTAQLRNVILSTADPISSNGSDGDIWIKYKA